MADAVEDSIAASPPSPSPPSEVAGAEEIFREKMTTAPVEDPDITAESTTEGKIETTTEVPLYDEVNKSMKMTCDDSEAGTAKTPNKDSITMTTATAAMPKDTATVATTSDATAAATTVADNVDVSSEETAVSDAPADPVPDTPAEPVPAEDMPLPHLNERAFEEAVPAEPVADAAPAEAEDFHVLAANLRLERQAARQVQATRRSRSFCRYWQVSYAALLLLVYHAFSTRKQFYPAAVYLGTSKVALITAGNAAVASVMLVFHGIISVFLGRLREGERDQMGEQLRYALTESCIALTMFREEITVQMAFFFLIMIAAKCLHWAVELRSTHVQQTDAVVSKKHMGFLILASTLSTFDLVAVALCARICDSNGPSYHILFGFEAAILVLSAVSTMAGYIIFAVDSRVDGVWHAKGPITFALEFGMEAVRFLFYVIFFAIVFMYYGMPLNLFRDVWMSFSSLRKKLAAFRRYRRLTANMNERFPDATEEELEECNRTCIICRDQMQTGKKLPCGHIFHFYCLRQWLQQQQSCPTCRTEIPTEMPAPGPRSAAQPDRANPAAEAAQRRLDNPAVAAPAVEENNAVEPNTVATPADPANVPPSSPPLSTNQDPNSATTDLLAPPSMVQTVATNPASESSFPCLYRITKEAGASVFPHSNQKDSPLRTVPKGVTVVVLGRSDDNGTVRRLKIPDGWIDEADLEMLKLPGNGTLSTLKLPQVSASYAQPGINTLITEVQSLRAELNEIKELLKANMQTSGAGSSTN